MAISKKFSKFNEEASLKGNKGVPGEGGTQGPSWLDKISREHRDKVRQFDQTMLRDFGRYIDESQRIQRGKEAELSKLCEDSFYSLFGTLLDDVTLDLKIGNEAAAMMDGVPEKEAQKIEDIVDQRVLDEIMKRKILKTIQQGKGLNSKALLNLPLFKEGITEILGNNAQRYIDNLNNIVKVCSFYDATLPASEIVRALKNSAGGACTIEIEEEDKNEVSEKSAEDLLKELESGIDLTDSESDILSTLNVTIKARAMDLGLLIHESLKGIYKLCTQMSLEHLPDEIAQQVLQNTDTIMDEPEEFKYGPSMQKQFEKIINSHPKVKSIIDTLTKNILDSDNSSDEENQLASFQEQLFFYVFGFLAALGKDDPKEMLKVSYAVLAEKNDDIDKLFFPIVANSVSSLEQEFKYQKGKLSNNVEASDDKPKTPDNSSDVKTLEQLRKELQEAEDNEEYERAGEISSEIRTRFPGK